MRAVLRFTIAMFAAELSLGPSLALAQSTSPPTTNTPATDTIGPRDLQSFSLNGTVTRSADTPTPAPRTQGRTPPASAAPATSRGALQASPPRPPASPRTSPRIPAPPFANPEPPASTNLPAAGTATAALSTSAPQPGFSSKGDAAPATLTPEPPVSLWPWLLLAGVVGAGAAFLLWRRRSREATAGAVQFDLYREPEPPPPARPVPSPPPIPPASTANPPLAGVVSTRLRPWVEITFTPLGCAVDDANISVEFEVQIFNSGSKPARDILVEASMFNASANQEHDLGAFFSKPAGEGDRIEVLPPLQSVTIRTALVAPRANIQLFELGGRQVFVPVVAFNALYRGGGSRGQTSVSYLLGRQTKSEKLGPLRADVGPRTFTALGVKLLPTGVRQ